MWGQSFLFLPCIWKPFVPLFEGLTFLQWFLCPIELKIIWKHQRMSFFSCLLLSTSLTLTVFTLSTPQFSPPSGVLSSSSSSVSALSGLLSPLGLYKECFLSLFYSWGCALLSLLPKKLLRGLAHQSPGWGRGQWIPWLSMIYHPSVPWASPWSQQGLRSLTSCGKWLAFLMGSLVTQSIGPTEHLSL